MYTNTNRKAHKCTVTNRKAHKYKDANRKTRKYTLRWLTCSVTHSELLAPHFEPLIHSEPVDQSEQLSH